MSVFPKRRERSSLICTGLLLRSKLATRILRLSMLCPPNILRSLISLVSRWVQSNREFLQARQSPLEFQLHRARYLHFLVECDPPEVTPAIAYAKTNFGRFYSQHETEVMRLMACIVYLPLERLRASPYADLASPNLYTDIDPMFAREYCASLGMSRQIPLKVVADIGGGGALARIEKGRKLMRERKSEWSQTDELPVRLLP